MKKLVQRHFDFEPTRALPLGSKPDGSAGGISIEPITVRIPMAIRLTGIGRSKLYELIKAGEIETVKVGSSTLLKMDSLKRLLDVGAR